MKNIGPDEGNGLYLALRLSDGFDSIKNYV